MSDFSNFLNSLSKASKDDDLVSVYGPGELFKGSSIPYGIKSGIPQLDLAIGRCGWPAGRIVELYGLAFSGKSCLALHAIANCQRMGGAGIYIDSEKTFDGERAQRLGVNIDADFSVAEVASVDAGFRTVRRITESLKESKYNRPMVVVYDSVVGVENEYDREREIGEDPRVGQEAKSMRKGVRAIASLVSDSKIVLMLVNHAIARISGNPYAKQTSSAGGNAIKLWSTLRVELTSVGKLKDKETELRAGQKIQMFLEKNKVGGISEEKFTVELVDGRGFDTVGNLLEASVQAGLVEHPKGSKTYTWTLDGTTFASLEWEALVENLGGVDSVYETFYNYCLSKKLMRAYS
jgi:recombination protein RecA